MNATVNIPQLMEAAMAHHVAGRLNEAAADYERILALDATQINARHNLGMVRLGLMQPAAALALMSQAFAEDGGNPAWTQSLPQIGMTLVQQGFWEAAVPWLQRALQHHPGDPALQSTMARIQPRNYLAPEVFDPQLGRVLKRYAPRESETWVYAIDVVGTCNLRCPTCPVGNFPADSRPKGFMEVDLFRQIVAKIKQECPARTPEIFLFNWGEPLLHPQLPTLIGILHEAGLPSHLSTNLNVERGIRELAKANPTNLKISLSGFTQETYGKTHARGDIALVKSNMHLLRHYLDKYQATTRVWVGHHLYRNNQHQIPEVAALCAELRFEHRPIAAFFQPLERLVDFVEGRGAPNPILDEMLEHPLQYLPRIKASHSGRYDCELRFNQTAINFDGSVALCCNVYDQSNMLGVQFLEQPHTALQDMKYAHPMCKTCIHHGLAYMPGDAATLVDGSTK